MYTLSNVANIVFCVLDTEADDGANHVSEALLIVANDIHTASIIEEPRKNFSRRFAG